MKKLLAIAVFALMFTAAAEAQGGRRVWVGNPYYGGPVVVAPGIAIVRPGVPAYVGRRSCKRERRHEAREWRRLMRHQQRERRWLRRHQAREHGWYR